MLQFLLSSIGRLLAHGPRFIPIATCWIFGNILYYFFPKKRRILLSNLHHAFPDRSNAWRTQTARISCQRLVEMGLFSLAASYFSPNQITEIIEANSKDVTLLSDNEATVGVSPHLCMMESIALTPGLSNNPLKEIGIIYRPLDIPVLDNYIKQTRERLGIKLLSRKNGFLEAMHVLKRKGSVGILFDQNAGHRGALSLFFNRLASISELAGILTEKFQTRLIGLHFARTGFWKVNIKAIKLLPPNSQKPTHEVNLIINQWLEDLLRNDQQACEDWMWIHDRWKCQNEAPLKIHSRNDILTETLRFKNLPQLPKSLRIWIRLPNWIGDVIMLLPLIRTLRISRPDAEITFLARPHILPLVERFKLHDRFIALPKKDWKYYAYFWKLRTQYPDIHLLFTNSFRGDLEAFLCGAPQRLGILREKKKRPLLTRAWHVPTNIKENELHQTIFWQCFMCQFGFPGSPLDLQSFTLKPHTPNPHPHTISIGLIPGTENSPEKRWPASHWIKLIYTLIQSHPNLKIYLFGTTRDTAITTLIADSVASENVIDLAGKTGLSEFIDHLLFCKVVVCNDTGGMHLANAIGTPIIGIFGPTNPVRTGPTYNGTKIILQPKGCPPTGGLPISEVDINTVYSALQPFLESSTPH